MADDNAINQAVARAILESAGASVATVGDGFGALKSLEVESFDVVLLDIHMPGMGGIEAVQRIRAGTAGRQNIPVIALTADAMPGVDERLIAAGFDHVAPKPIDPAALIWAIAELGAPGRRRHKRVRGARLIQTQRPRLGPPTPEAPRRRRLPPPDRALRGAGARSGLGEATPPQAAQAIADQHRAGLEVGDGKVGLQGGAFGQQAGAQNPQQRRRAGGRRQEPPCPFDEDAVAGRCRRRRRFGSRGSSHRAPATPAAAAEAASCQIAPGGLVAQKGIGRRPTPGRTPRSEAGPEALRPVSRARWRRRHRDAGGRGPSGRRRRRTRGPLLRAGARPRSRSNGEAQPLKAERCQDGPGDPRGDQAGHRTSNAGSRSAGSPRRDR